MDSEGAKLIVWLLSSAVKEVGFPVFVAIYLLLRVDPAIRQLTKAVQSLSDVTQVAAHLTRRSGDPKP